MAPRVMDQEGYAGRSPNGEALYTYRCAACGRTSQASGMGRYGPVCDHLNARQRDPEEQYENDPHWAEQREINR